MSWWLRVAKFILGAHNKSWSFGSRTSLYGVLLSHLWVFYAKTDAEISDISLLSKLSVSKTEFFSYQESSVGITNLRNTDINRWTISDLNVNSVSCKGKWDQLQLSVQAKVNFFVIAESKLHKFSLFSVSDWWIFYFFLAQTEIVLMEES